MCVGVFCRRDRIREVPEVGGRRGSDPQSAGRYDRTPVRRAVVCALPADAAQLEARSTSSEAAVERRIAAELCFRSVDWMVINLPLSMVS